MFKIKMQKEPGSEISKILDPEIDPKTTSGLKVKSTTLNRITFTPNNAKSGETLRINLPKLQREMTYVPNSIFLLFDLVIGKGQANNTQVNNVGRNLVKNFKVYFDVETVQDTGEYGVYKTYKDYFDCTNDLRQGESSLNFRKLRCGAGDKNTSNAAEVKAAGIYGMKHVIPLDFEMFSKHGVFNSHALKGDIRMEITLAPKDDIVVTSDTNKDYDYFLENIQLEYKCIRSERLYSMSLGAYQVGKQFLYDHVSLLRKSTFKNKDDEIIRQHIGVNMRSAKGVLIFFRRPQAGAADADSYLYPDLESVNVTIDGVPNMLYSQGMTKTDFYNSAISNFTMDGYGNRRPFDQLPFFTNKFALWVDLRSFPDDKIHGSGTKVNGYKDGVKLEIKRKKSSGDFEYTYYVFLVSDATVDVQERGLKQVLY